MPHRSEISIALPPADRTRAAIVASNYGEAAAIDVYGRDLPPALSEQNQDFLWGTHGFDGSVVIAINGRPRRWARFCRSLAVAGYFGSQYAMPYENHRPIMICRDLETPLPVAWPRLKRYGT